MTPLEQKARRLRDQLKGDRNVQAVGVAEKGEYNPEEFICIYAYKPGNYPLEFEGTRVVSRYVWEIVPGAATILPTEKEIL